MGLTNTPKLVALRVVRFGKDQDSTHNVYVMQFRNFCESIPEVTQTGPKSWICDQEVGDSVIVRATTQPDNWTAWTKISWDCDGGKQVTGSPNGWSVPRAIIRKNHIKASLGGISDHVEIVVTHCAITTNCKLVDCRGRPIKPKGTGKMVNIWGDRETVGFEDYNPEDQNGQYNTRGDGTERLFTFKGEGKLPDHCVSDICCRSSPLSFNALLQIDRIAMPGCRVTYSTNEGTGNHKQLLTYFKDRCKVIELCKCFQPGGKVDRQVTVIEVYNDYVK